MLASLRRSSYIIIESIFLSMVATAFSSLIIQNTIKLENEAVSPQMQPLLLIYYPLRVVERFDLAEPEIVGDSVTVKADDGSELWLMCSPESQSDFVITVDKIEGTAIVRNEQPAPGWQLSHTKCSNKVTASTHNTETLCGDHNNDATIYEIGFLVYIGTEDEGSSSSQNTESKKRDKKLSGRKFSFGLRNLTGFDSKKKEPAKRKPTEFISLYESCFDNEKKIVLFTKHTVHGSRFAAKMRLDSIPVLPDGEWFYDDRGLHNLFEKDVQFETFFDILNPYDDVTNYNDRAMRFLVPLQLIPADNMIFYSWRATAFTRYNITGVWESIVGIGWRRVQETVDQYLSEVPQKIQIVTGTFEILQLGRKNQDIYLRLNTTPPSTGVPHIIWKLLYNTDTHEAIVIISVNNPHAAICEEPLCTDLCSNDDSPLAFFKDPWTGCIICCSYKDAKKKIKDIPTIAKVATQVLRFKNFIRPTLQQV